MARSNDHSMLSFSRNCQTVSHGSCPISHSRQQGTRVPDPPPTLANTIFYLIPAILVGMMGISLGPGVAFPW